MYVANTATLLHYVVTGKNGKFMVASILYVLVTTGNFLYLHANVKKHIFIKDKYIAIVMYTLFTHTHTHAQTHTQTCRPQAYSHKQKARTLLSCLYILIQCFWQYHNWKTQITWNAQIYLLNTRNFPITENKEIISLNTGNTQITLLNRRNT